MARYMIFWEGNHQFTPGDPKAKDEHILGLVDMVKQQLKSGQLKEWGIFSGETRGYMVVEGDENDVYKATYGYVPFINFTTKLLATIDQVEGAVKS